MSAKKYKNKADKSIVTAMQYNGKNADKILPWAGEVAFVADMRGSVGPYIGVQTVKGFVYVTPTCWIIRSEKVSVLSDAEFKAQYAEVKS